MEKWKRGKMISEASQSQARKKSTKILTFWVRRPPSGLGVFHAKGWWPKSSCPPSKVCLPWVSKRGIWDVPGILPGCPGPLGVFKKFVRKKSSCAFFSFPIEGPEIFIPFLYRALKSSFLMRGFSIRGKHPSRDVILTDAGCPSLDRHRANSEDLLSS